tara:strand:+ start:1701 stop:2594 length:894 start_codon:yes stop_codon:yes gene_type:complete
MLDTLKKYQGIWNRNIDRFNANVNAANTVPLNTTEKNPSEGTTEDAIQEIRNAFPFSDVVFSFPVTEKGVRLRIPAFLVSHNDSFSSNWNPQSVYGRADPIPIYRNTTRSISLSFKVPNQDINDANANFLSLGTLVRNLYPVYKTFGSNDMLGLGALVDAASGLAPNEAIVGAPLVRVKFANLICNSATPGAGLLGYMTNLSITMDTANGYLIDPNNGGGEPLMYPRMVNFSFNFNPLHEHKLGWGTNDQWLGGNADNYPYATKNSNENVPSELPRGSAAAAFSGDSTPLISALFGR